MAVVVFSTTLHSMVLTPLRLVDLSPPPCFEPFLGAGLMFLRGGHAERVCLSEIIGAVQGCLGADRLVHAEGGYSGSQVIGLCIARPRGNTPHGARTSNSRRDSELAGGPSPVLGPPLPPPKIANLRKR